MAFTFSKLDSITVGSTSVSEIIFSSIPQNYKDLCLKLSLRTDRATVTDNISVRFNLDYNNNYSLIRLRGDGAATSSTTASAQGSINITASINGSTGTASTFANQELYIPNYTSNNYKSISLDSIGENNGTTAYQFLLAGLWQNNTAINSIRLSSVGNIVQYSTATLYGIRAEV